MGVHEKMSMFRSYEGKDLLKRAQFSRSIICITKKLYKKGESKLK